MSGTDGDSFKRYLATIPKVFRPEFNRVIKALLLSIASAEDEQCKQVANAKDQLFVRTATGQNLDRLANSLGVSRPATLGLTDSEFQELIPNLSLKPKQIRKAFYDTADVFWGPLFSRANVTTNNVAPFNLIIGDELSFIINNGETQTVKILTGDVATPGSATAEEVVTLLEKLDGTTASILEDSLTGNKAVNLRTDTPGSTGDIQVLASSGIGTSKLDFTVGQFDILDLDQRVTVYNINPNELVIEIPAIVPALRRTLKGSHHFHADGTIEPPKGTAQGIWQGSFLFDPNGTRGNFTISSQKAVLQTAIFKGDVLTAITVDDTSLFKDNSGDLILGFGMSDQEVPIRFRGVPNSNTILIDPSYTFTQDHPVGTIINVSLDRKSHTPLRNGNDLAVYLTSPSGAREIVQAILETLKAAGIIIRFIVLAPKYKYLLDNPYLSEDNAPNC